MRRNINVIIAIIVIICAALAIYLNYNRVPPQNGIPLSTTVHQIDKSLINKGGLFVAFLDVGQGDSAFIRTPSGKNILIDGGGSVNSGNGEVIGEQVVIPFLRHMGVSSLDIVILTHPHTDHMQGLLPVLETMPVKTVMDPFLYTDSDDYLRFLNIIKKKHINHTKLYKGKVIDFKDGVKGYVLNPPNYPPNYRSEDLNNDSLVIRFTYGNKAFLFMGDAAVSAEKRILSSDDDVRCNVIKIGHHGSRFSTTEELLNKAKPEIAVISVGANNPFRHPSNSTIEKLRKRHIRIYRTDKDGAIIVTCDNKGTAMNVKTFK